MILRKQQSNRWFTAVMLGVRFGLIGVSLALTVALFASAPSGAASASRSAASNACTSSSEGWCGFDLYVAGATVSPPGWGTVTISPTPPFNDGGPTASTCSDLGETPCYVGGWTSPKSITLTATPTSGSYFGGWNGACSGSSLKCTLPLPFQNEATCPSLGVDDPPGAWTAVCATFTATPRCPAVASTRGSSIPVLSVADVSDGSGCLKISTTSLPDATMGMGMKGMGDAYSTTIQATGGTAPYKFSISHGLLPPGLVLKAGKITGTPIVEFATTFTISVRDSKSQTAARTLVLNVAPPTNVQHGYAYFIGTGLDDSQAAGLVGNLQLESGNYMNPRKQQENCTGKNCGKGIGQWDQSRWTQLMELATKEKLLPYDLTLQLQFVLQELQQRQQVSKIAIAWKTVRHKKIPIAWKSVFVCDKSYDGESSFDGLKQCTNITSATRFVEEQYERPGIPHLNGRTQYAARISEYCQAAECK